jgi:hypothetical protein
VSRLWGSEGESSHFVGTPFSDKPKWWRQQWKISNLVCNFQELLGMISNYTEFYGMFRYDFKCFGMWAYLGARLYE